jgi:hypothetical protein
LNKSDNESEDNENNDYIYKYNKNINNSNKLNTKSNRTSKRNNEIIDTCNGKMKKNKISKKNLNINVNSNCMNINGREIKTERIYNTKIKIEKNINNNKNNINEIKNNKNIKIKTKNININLGGNKNVFLSPKNNYKSFLIKKKKIRGNKSERILNKNKMKNNNNKIHDIRVKFNSPPTKNIASRTYRYFNFESNKLKNMQNVFTNNSFVNKKNKNNKLTHSLRYQYMNFTQKQKSSQSYNSNNTSDNKDNLIKSVEIINKYLFDKNKNNNFSSENDSFQKQHFKNKINLNKHHLNDNLVSHFKNLNFK